MMNDGLQTAWNFECEFRKFEKYTFSKETDNFIRLFKSFYSRNILLNINYLTKKAQLFEKKKIEH